MQKEFTRCQQYFSYISYLVEEFVVISFLTAFGQSLSYIYLVNLSLVLGIINRCMPERYSFHIVLSSSSQEPCHNVTNLNQPCLISTSLQDGGPSQSSHPVLLPFYPRSQSPAITGKIPTKDLASAMSPSLPHIGKLCP